MTITSADVLPSARPHAAAGEGPATELRSSRLAPWLAGLAVVFAVLPIVSAAGGAVASHWLPIGDNALFSIRAHDVFTSHHPLLGTWTSASQTLGKNVNNPGPLEFDLLALPAKVFGGVGVAIGAAFGNVVAVLGIAVFARRRGGPMAVAAAMAAAAGLAWTMGSELLFDPWQPHALLLPFLLLLTLVWSTVDGDLLALPFAVGVASFIVQTHLSYAVLVASTVGTSVVVVVVRSVRAGRLDRFVRAAGASFVVAAVCWVQPLIEQVEHGSDGNLATLASTGGGGGKAIGLRLAVRLVASVVSVPPFWTRPSFRDSFILLGFVHLPGLAVAAGSLVALAVVLVLCAGANLRAGDRTATTAVVMAAVALGASIATATIVPLNHFSTGIAPHQLRWLWPVSVFTSLSIAFTIVRRVRLPVTGMTAALAGIAILFGGLAVPTFRQYAGPSADAYAIPVARRLAAGTASLQGRGPLLFDVRKLRFAEPYSTTVMAELQRRHIDFRVDDGGLIHQLGPAREATGAERGRLFLRESDAAFEPQGRATLVSRVVGLTPTQHAEMLSLREDVRGYVADRGLALNHRGRDTLRANVMPNFAGAGGVVHDLNTILYSGELTLGVQQNLVTLDPAWRSRFRRYVDLEERWAKRTVALFLDPQG